MDQTCRAHGRHAVLLTALLAILTLAGCRAVDQPADDRPRVLATIGMIGDLARRIAGDAAVVETLMGPGVDPHLFKASASDVTRLSAADIILYNGLFLEGKLVEVLKKMPPTGKRQVVQVTAAIAKDRLIAPTGENAHHDPHVWNDVPLWAETIAPIEAALAKRLPAEKERFAARAAALRRELNELDVWVKAEIAKIPESRRVLVTAHDAFEYFGRRYGLEVRGLQGISTATEAGVRDVDELAAFIVSRALPAIFVESSVPKKAIEALQAACKSKGHTVVIGGELFSDAMGAAGTPEGTYPGMIRYNVNTVVRALAGVSQ